MGKRSIERQLRKTGTRLRSLRDELGVIDEQIPHLADEADDLHTRALVAEYPGAASESRDARAHLDALTTHRERVIGSIADLERRQDRLLDELSRG